jgi:hypothetical protein
MACTRNRYAPHGDPVRPGVHGGFAAVNRGADFVKFLVPALRARTRNLTGHRTPINQTASA